MQEIYSLRQSFSIIGITGRMGSGCTKVSKLLSKSKEEFFAPIEANILRDPNSIMGTDNSSNIFKRKYNICYSFVKKNWIQYQIIDYKYALLLYCLDFCKNDPDPIRKFAELLHDNFRKSETLDEDFPDIRIDKEHITKEFNKLHLYTVIQSLKLLNDNITEINSKKDLKIVYDIFFNNQGEFIKTCSFIINHLGSINYFLRTLLFHRIANNLRSSGTPFKEINQSSRAHIYTIATTINRLIKCYKKENKTCHIAINSLKNSLEIMFFKERYSAFYIAAVHNDNRYKSRIKDRVKHTDYQEETYQKLLKLDSTEYKSDEFSDGSFDGPDIQNCIQKSEIHINNSDEQSGSPDFNTLNEQIIKYQALIQQPGIITPSSMERCMQIAYNSKFNSGCISRQVGAVITDKEYSVKSVGWNDVPKGSTPCLLRNVNELVEQKDSSDYNSYSEFELSTKEEFEYQPRKQNNKEFVGKTFVQNTEQAYADRSIKVTESGKNCSYCFKKLHNQYEGKDNQVHTRSLHAEENAMLQISKYGGQPLNDGILFTTASPCELCSKKAYQLGISIVIYIDPYPGISMSHILNNGFNAPKLVPFKGVIGKSYNKLYEPFMSYKDELEFIMKS